LPEEEVDQQSSTRPFWSGTISFGLVSIPVNLFPANRSSHVGLRTLAPDGTPLRRRYYSVRTDKELAPEQMVRGYEFEPGKYVVITDDELDKLEPEKSHDIDLRRFVNKDAIPPLYFERGYFLAPAAGSTKAYQLLAAVMEKTRRAGVATFIMRGKEYLTAIVAEKGILRAETMRFKDEVRSPQDIGLPGRPKVSEQTVRHFQQIIAKKSARELSRDGLHDETAAALLAIVKKKQTQKENVIESSDAEAGEQPEMDILQVLKRSLTGHPGARTRRRSKAGKPARTARPPRLHSSKRAKTAAPAR
jgi:DNA end-binding protein Ku